MTLIICLLIWLVWEFVFFLLHRDPLNEKEILNLSQKRTRKYIRNNYTFTRATVSVDKQFKSLLDPRGKWYNVNERLSSFPSYVAMLLKGKKHEWIILAIEREGVVLGFYANKGRDKSSVSFNCDLEYIMKKCEENRCSTIMCFHNHPNDDPNYQTCLLASEQDKRSAVWCAEQVIHSYNWLEFVCERGNFIKFFEQYSPSFTPECAKMEQISAENNLTQFENYKLHRELCLFNSKDAIAKRNPLKTIFPCSFRATELVSFIITLIIYAVIDVVCGFIIGLLAKIPVINLVTGLLGSLLGLYGLIGIVLAILVFIKVLK